MRYIQGENREQITLFPEAMDDYIDENNTVRVIDVYVDNLDLKNLNFAKHEPNETGRPMYSPQDMLKLYIYGYMNRIRSSRRLETESKRNIELIWLLSKLSPDHKTIARFRHENRKALKNVFHDFIKLSIKLGLYGKELISIDGSKFKAVNSKERNFNNEKLAERIQRIEAKIAEYISELDKNDGKESTLEKGFNADKIKEIIKKLEARKIEYKSITDELEQIGETQKSLTDPDSRLMKANGKLDMCYNIQTAVDGKNGLIAEFIVTNQVNDKGQLYDVAVATKETLGVDVITAIADRGYENATEIAKCIKENINPQVAMESESIHICMETTEEATKPENHVNGRCIYDKNRNIGICPMGEILKPSTYNKKRRRIIFANSKVCKKCNSKCTIEDYKKFEVAAKKEDFKREYDDTNLKLRQIEIKPDKKMILKRKCLSEHPFGIVKKCMDSSYCLTKGIDNVLGEFSLAFLAFNIKRAINILGTKKIIQGIYGFQD